MNRNTTWLIVLIAALAAGVIYFFQFSGTEKKDRVVSEDVFTEYAIEDTASVTRIEIAESTTGKKVILDRSEDSWQLNDRYDVRKDLLDLILNTFKTVRFKNYLEKNAVEQNMRVLATAHKEVKIFINGEHRYTWFVGTPVQDDGTVMLMEKKTEDGWVRSREPVINTALRFKGELNTRFTADEGEWRSTGIFNYNPLDIASIDVDYSERPEDGFKAYLEGTNTFRLEDHRGNPVSLFDTAALRRYFVEYKKVHFETFNKRYTEEMKDSLKALDPYFTITVQNKSGVERSVDAYRIGLPEGTKNVDGTPLDWDVDRMHGFVQDTTMVVIQFFVFDKLTKQLNDFRPLGS